ncbi:MAG: hypothetical protein GY795_11300 [Desulfobacterales bacterium]|nr:hypothetical protein [Desulfobacterales bacterium]
MAKVKVGKGRSKIVSSQDVTEIIIPSKKNLVAIIFLGCWSVGWAFCGVMAISEFFTDATERSFLSVILVGWIFGGIIAIYPLLWNLAGKEIISLSSKELIHKRNIFGLGKLKRYHINLIENIRLTTENSEEAVFGFGSGTIAFDYSQKTFKFGSNIDEAEAKHIINVIAEKYKIYKKRTEINRVKVEVGKLKASITSTENCTEIVIPSQKKISVILLSAIIFIAWFFTGVFLIYDSGLSIFPVIIITYGSAVTLYSLLWNLKGKEIITVTDKELAHKRVILELKIGKTKEYKLNHIKDMRPVNKSLQEADWGFGGGTITFDYGKKTCRLGSGVDETEAKYIINILAEKHRISKQ